LSPILAAAHLSTGETRGDTRLNAAQ
jgi:hypothetical protein